MYGLRDERKRPGYSGMSLLTALVKWYLSFMKKPMLYWVVLFVLQFIVAVICAPYSCEWGNTVYFFTGVVCLFIAFLLSIFQKQWTFGKRLLVGLLMLLLSVVLWCAGFGLLDFKIM